MPRELTRCLVPSPERPQLPPPSRTWPHLASSTASSTTSTVDCLTTLLRVLLTHFPIMPKFHCRFGDEKGRPVGISKSPLSVQAPTRTAPTASLSGLSMYVQLTQQCQSLGRWKASSFEVACPFLSLPVCLADAFSHPFFFGQASSCRPLQNMTVGHVRLNFLPISPDDSEK